MTATIEDMLEGIRKAFVKKEMDVTQKGLQIGALTGEMENLTTQTENTKCSSQECTQRSERLEDENRSLKLHVIRMQRAAADNQCGHFKKRHFALLQAYKALDNEKIAIEEQYRSLEQ